MGACDCDRASSPIIMKPEQNQPLVFALNGERVELPNVDPATTLLSYIRSETRFKGPKRSCGEGGCGACLVMVARYDPKTHHVTHASINSCLVLVRSLHHAAITTAEGLGPSHAIPRRLAAFHGSQCGFCTPGMTMAIYNRLKQPPGSKADMEHAVQGNLCRCTGYRPILDVCKSFATDVDVEDLGINTCWRKKEDARLESLPAYDPGMDPAFPEFLIRELGQECGNFVTRFGGEERGWISARSFAELDAALERFRDAKLVVGNTSSGFYKDERPRVFVDISQIPELLTVRRDAHGLEVGAATRISELINYLDDFSPNPVAQGLVSHMKKIAGVHVRNWGSVGGNLIMAKDFAFSSDMATILLGAGASATLKGGTTMPLDAFLELKTRVVLQGLIESVTLAFGAFGTRHAVRALRVEEVLRGKRLTLELVKEAVEVLKTEVVPLDGAEKREFRASLVVGFLFEFLHSLLSGSDIVTPAPLFPHVGKQVITVTDEIYPLAQPLANLQAELQASGEVVYTDDIPSPALCLHGALVLSSEPYAKIRGVDTEAALKSPGAVTHISAKDIPEGGQNVGYFFDLPEFETEILFPEDIAGYVGQPLGLMVADTYDNARLAAGKVRVDYDTHGLEAPIFTCDEAVARNSVYPIPESLHSLQHQRIGDVEKALSEAEFQLEGEVETHSQNHFYMETQATLAVPEEDDCMTIYCATQGVDHLQQSLAACLNLPLNKVRVVCHRIGGGFGGKGLRTQTIAIAVALAARKLRRPVRISLDRNTDMQMIGGRAPTKSTFAVAFTNTGKITGLKLNVLLELGWLKDFFLVTLFSIHAPLKKYDYGALDLKYTFCKTNHVPKTAVRAPTLTQMNAIADVILDHVASYLGTSGNKVREANLHSMESLKVFHDAAYVGNEDSYTLPAIWNQLKTQARVGERETGVENFNKQHRWLKRGLAMVPIIFQIMGPGNTSVVSLFQDGSVVAEVGGVEMGQGLHTKVRQAIAYAFSSLCSKEDVSKILKNVRILPLDSLHLPNTWLDAGSTTSVAVCATLQRACGVLVERLLPLKEELQSSNGKVSWESLCLTAKMRQVDLQSHERWASPEYKCLTHGAAVSEVEVNILTGETRVLATDMIYDGGKSLNHLVDIGQVEGAFVFGLGFFLTEEVVRNSKGKVVSDGTWTYKPPTMDIIPQTFNVELYKSPYHNDQIFSSKGVGEPPLLLSSSVFSAVRMAIGAARSDYEDDGGHVDSQVFTFNPPATMDKVKKLCGLDNVEKYLQAKLNSSTTSV